MVIKSSTSKYTELQVQFLNPLNILYYFPGDGTQWIPNHVSDTPAEQNSAEQLTCQVHSCCWEPSTHRYDSVQKPLDTICQPVKVPVLWILLLEGVWGGGVCGAQDRGPRSKRTQRMAKERMLLRCQVKLSALGWALQWPVHLVRVQSFVQPFDWAFSCPVCWTEWMTLLTDMPAKSPVFKKCWPTCVNLNTTRDSQPAIV